MTPEDARKLLGGYATGTLTEAEERALFAAALDDQALFDELAREQALRDVLRDSSAKAQLLAALDERPRAWWRSWRPAAAVLAMAGLAAVAVVVVRQKTPERATVQLTARVDARGAAPALPEAAAPTAVPAPVEPQGAASAIPAPKPQAKRRAFQAPAPASPAVAATELAEAPKVEIHNLEDRAPREIAGGVIGGVVGGAPATLPSVRPPATVVTPMFETASDARMQFQARVVEASRPSARALFLGGTQAPLRIQPTAAVRSGPTTVLVGLRYSIVRRDSEETAAIRFTANVNGYLSIAGAAPVALTAMQPYTTPPLSDQEVKVVFARQPQTTIATPVAPLTEVSGGETYVVNTMPTGALGFTIPLTRK